MIGVMLIFYMLRPNSGDSIFFDDCKKAKYFLSEFELSGYLAELSISALANMG